MEASFKEKLRPYVLKYKAYIDELEKDNPYGVPIGLGNWAGGGSIVRFGTTICFANKHFPDIIDASHAFQNKQLAIWLPSLSQLSPWWPPWVQLDPKKSFMATTGLISHLFRAMLLQACCSENPITLKITTTGHFCGDKTRGRLVEIPVI
jgi:hypothetical protein